MEEICVLIIDDDVDTASFLMNTFADRGVVAEVVGDTFAAIEKLRDKRYEAIVLDPMIRQRLNGYVVLNFLELEQPETLMRLFLLTGMSEQTIHRTAPSVASRLFRKPSAINRAAAAVIDACNAESASAAQHLRATRSVLVVEDDQSTALATVGLLEQLGYAVEHVRNGEEAYDVLSKRDFDVVMLDLVMPKVDGFTLIDQFHDSKPGLLRRIIVTTGIPEKYIEALDRTAIGGFIRKPLDLSHLEQLLKRVSASWTRFEGGGESPLLKSPR